MKFYKTYPLAEQLWLSFLDGKDLDALEHILKRNEKFTETGDDGKNYECEFLDYELDPFIPKLTIVYNAKSLQ